SNTQNNKLGETTIAPATQGVSFQFLMDRRDGTRLGFSLINDSATGGQFALIARDQFNFEVTRQYDIIEPWSQVSRFVDQMLTLRRSKVLTFVITEEFPAIRSNTTSRPRQATHSIPTSSGATSKRSTHKGTLTTFVWMKNRERPAVSLSFSPSRRSRSSAVST